MISVLKIQKIKEKLDSRSNKKKELIEVINFSNKFFSIKSSGFNFDNQIYKEFEKLYSFLNIEKSLTRLFNGEKINITEDKAALHWQTRDPKSNIYNDLIKKSRELKKQLKKNSIRNIVTLGIGGSYEGPKLLIESFLDPINLKYKHVFVTGSDSEEFKEKISSLKQKETIFIISSKSMNTVEVINNFKLAKKWMSLKLNDSTLTSRFYAITSNCREANNLGIEEKNIINLKEEVGGRYSIWSEVSLTSLIESENNFTHFLKGGYEADLRIKSENNYKKAIKKLSYLDIWNSNFLNIDNRVILSYIWKLRSLPKYLQQLEMESLGKKANKNSIFSKTSQTVYGEYGPRAQHSFFQMLHQGTSNTSADFIISNDKSESNKLPRMQALTQNKLFTSPVNKSLKNHLGINSNISSNFFVLKKLSPFNLGFLISSLEHKTFITSQLLQVNPFDQFGVEEGKRRVSKKFN